MKHDIPIWMFSIVFFVGYVLSSLVVLKCDDIGTVDYPDYIKNRLFKEGYADYKIDENGKRYWVLKDTVNINREVE